MPTYEYVCSKCDHQFDVFQSIAEKALKLCPKEKCGKKRWGKGRVKRAISSGGGLIFKGSGFYITDYRDAGYKEKVKAESGDVKSDAKGEAKADGKVDSKSGGEAGSSQAPAASGGDSKSPAAPNSEPKSSPKPDDKSSKKKH